MRTDRSQGCKTIQYSVYCNQKIATSISFCRYGLIEPTYRDNMYGIPYPCRGLFIVDPRKTVRMMSFHPWSVGRSTNELIRTLDSLQLTDAFENKVLLYYLSYKSSIFSLTRFLFGSGVHSSRLGAKLGGHGGLKRQQGRHQQPFPHWDRHLHPALGQDLHADNGRSISRCPNTHHHHTDITQSNGNEPYTNNHSNNWRARFLSCKC